MLYGFLISFFVNEPDKYFLSVLKNQKKISKKIKLKKKITIKCKNEKLMSFFFGWKNGKWQRNFGNFVFIQIIRSNALKPHFHVNFFFKERKFNQQ